jgi:aminopeptidase N
MLTLDGGSSPGYFGLLAHEVGHNWFFGMVGNNETYRASLDEGFTQFLTHWSTSKLLGEYPKYKGKDKYVKNHYKPVNLRETTVYLGYMNDALADEDMPLNTHSDDFNSALGHGGGYRAVYYKTATMLYNLQYVLGDSLFLYCMQSYFNQWKTCHPYFEDFRASMIHYSKTDLNWFFDQWMETTKKVDYKIYRPKFINSAGNNQFNYLINTFEASILLK